MTNGSFSRLVFCIICRIFPPIELFRVINVFFYYMHLKLEKNLNLKKKYGEFVLQKKLNSYRMSI